MGVYKSIFLILHYILGEYAKEKGNFWETAKMLFADIRHALTHPHRGVCAFPEWKCYVELQSWI